jgi:hypothetical protein
MNCVVCGQPTRSSAAEPTCSIKCYKIKNKLCIANGCHEFISPSSDEYCSKHQLPTACKALGCYKPRAKDAAYCLAHLQDPNLDIPF